MLTPGTSYIRAATAPHLEAQRNGASDYLVFIILCDLCFRQVLEHKGAWREPLQRYLEGHSFVHDVHLLSEFKKTSGMAGHPDFVKFTRSSFLGLLLWLKPRGLNKLFDMITPSDIIACFAFIEESVAARRRIEEESKSLCKDGKGMRQDMFHFLFQARDPDTGKQLYSPQELFA